MSKNNTLTKKSLLKYNKKVQKEAFKMEKHKYYTDQERYEHCRKCRISGKTITEYASENGLNRTTLRD